MQFTEGQNGTTEGRGAIFVQGGTLKIVNCRFTQNRCKATGADVSGGALYVTKTYNRQSVWISDSLFGGIGMDKNECSNGGAIGGYDVSFQIQNTKFIKNIATGKGGNPATTETGGGDGGAIYQDGDLISLTISESEFIDNYASEKEGSLFFRSRSRKGTLNIQKTNMIDNSSLKNILNYPGIFVETETENIKISSDLKFE